MAFNDTDDKISLLELSGEIIIPANSDFLSNTINCFPFSSINLQLKATGNFSIQFFEGITQDTTLAGVSNYATVLDRLFKEDIPANQDFNKSIAINYKYGKFLISNTTGTPITMTNYCYFNHNPYNPIGIRDTVIHFEDSVSNVRNTSDFFIDVADGNLEGFKIVNLHSKGTILSNVNELPLQSVLGNQPLIFDALNAGKLYQIKSTSANDLAASTGASKIVITGISAGDNTETTETITLNGINAVNTTNLYRWINKAVVSELAATNSNYNIGNISIKPLVVGNPLDFTLQPIPIKENTGENSSFYVPAGQILYIKSIEVNCSCEDAGDLFINVASFKTNSGGVQNVLTKRIKSFPCLNNTMISYDCLIPIQSNEILYFTTKAKAQLQGQINTVHISLLGYLKHTDFLTVQ